nr:MAG TPA: hypothetical protein [Caudoviricetes sp.]
MILINFRREAFFNWIIKKLYRIISIKLLNSNIVLSQSEFSCSYETLFFYSSKFRLNLFF